MDKNRELTIEELMVESYKCSEQALSDLKYAFSMDYSIVNACYYAGITTDTYYRWVKLSDEFSLLMGKFQNLLFNKALSNIVERINIGDIKISMWFLSRRDRRYANEATNRINCIKNEQNSIVLEIGSDEKDNF